MVYVKVLIIFSLKKLIFYVDLELYVNIKYKDFNDLYNYCRKDIKIDD